MWGKLKNAKKMTAKNAKSKNCLKTKQQKNWFNHNTYY